MIYLDNAATTKDKPAEVIDAVVNALSAFGNPGRGAHDASLGASRTVFEARCLVSDLFNGYGPEYVAFTQNSTMALNIVIKGLVGSGDHVITTVLEHNSVLRPLYEMKSRGTELTFVGCDSLGRIDYADIEAAVRSNTRAIVCTHGSNLTGNVLDLNEIGKIAHRHGLIFIVDASQTAGAIGIDMQRCKADVICFTGHKSLRGPQGTGGLCVRNGLKIRNLLSGGSGIHSFEKEHPDVMPTALEAGTLNAHGIAGLCAAVKVIGSEGIDSIFAKEDALARRFYNGVKDIKGLSFYGDYSAEIRCPIVTLNILDIDSSEVADELFERFGICVRGGAHCAPLMHEAFGTRNQGAVRFSFSPYNTEEETDAAIEAVRTLVGEAL